MTRVNCISPSLLSDHHLIAEWHEISRVTALAHRRLITEGKIEGVPDSYRMGRGHVIFFFNKAMYIQRRLTLLYLEIRARGMQPSMALYNARIKSSRRLPAELQNEWSPSKEDKRVNARRLQERDPVFYARYWHEEPQ